MFSYFKKQHINLDIIKEHKFELIKFAHIKESDIQKIWRQSNEPELRDFTNLTYCYEIPLYQKMIFRFRNGNNRTSRLYQGCPKM